MKKPIDMDSAKVKKDLVQFFHEKFSSLTKKEIAEQIEESLNDNGRYSSYGTCYSVTVDGEEFNLIPSFDEFHQIAIDYVTQMLEDEPETFNQDFLQNHIYITDTDKRIIADEEAEAFVEDMSSRDIIDLHAQEVGHPYEEDDDDYDIDSFRDDLRNNRYDVVYRSLDRDPLDYFVNELGAYSVEDLMKANFINIDTESAAEEAVQVDGEAHFLSHYDGNYEETGLGIIVMKE